jgi:recombination protein RecR
MDRPEQELSELAASIAGLSSSVRLCRECFNVSEHDRCAICNDSSREPSQILVVERVSDLQSIERSGLWRGRYHVLGGSIEPGSDANGLHIAGLQERIRKVIAKHGDAELALATGTDSAGEATALYLRKSFSPTDKLRITRLAKGLASGTHVEYADEATLKHAVEQRR